MSEVEETPRLKPSKSYAIFQTIYYYKKRARETEDPELREAYETTTEFLRSNYKLFKRLGMQDELRKLTHEILLNLKQEIRDL